MRNKRQNKNRFIKIILSIIILLLAGIILYKTIQQRILSSMHFNVKSINIKSEEEGLESIYDFVRKETIGKNIFQVDLADVSKRIIKKFSHVSKALLMRRFPDKIEIEISLRKPLAKLLTGRGSSFLDRETVFFQSASEIEEFDNLAILKGIDNNSPKTTLKNIVNLVELINKSNLGEELQLTEIIVDNRQEFIFYLKPGFSVKIGDDRFKERLERLKLLLDDVKPDLVRLDYIDLRFNEPTLGYKDAKTR